MYSHAHAERKRHTHTHTLCIDRETDRDTHTNIHAHIMLYTFTHTYIQVYIYIYIYITHQLVRILLQFLLCQYHRRPTVTQGIRVPVNTAHNIQWAPYHQHHCTSHLPHHHHTYTACVNSDIYGGTIGANNNVNLSGIFC